MMATSQTILGLASYEKGIPFLRESKRQGCTVLLLTVPALEHAPWPRESIDEIFYMPDLADVPAVINGVSYLARRYAIDRIVPLDEYDVPVAAALREHLRLPGMGDSAARFVRDKLAMRMGAHQAGISVPDFTAATNDAAVAEYLGRVPGPWLVKPRAEASTIGIARVETAEEVWARLESLGDRRSFHLIERFVPGDVFHVDSLIAGGTVVFASVGQYGRPPLDVFHGGGIARTHMIRRRSADEKALQDLNREVIAALCPSDGVTHMEFIKAHGNGRFYFLEVAARVGGAHISDVIEHATGLNLWAEWAKLEAAQDGTAYALPEIRHNYGAVMITLARQEAPDTSAYRDPEIVWRMEKAHHVGFILVSPGYDRLIDLLDSYTERFAVDFTATLPPWTSRPPSDS
jgi:biotin carboxylase